jgi:hypothetical protein
MKRKVLQEDYNNNDILYTAWRWNGACLSCTTWTENQESKSVGDRSVRTCSSNTLVIRICMWEHDRSGLIIRAWSMEPVRHTDGTGAAPYMRPRIATNKATELLVALSFRRHIFFSRPVAWPTLDRPHTAATASCVGYCWTWARVSTLLCFVTILALPKFIRFVVIIDDRDKCTTRWCRFAARCALKFSASLQEQRTFVVICMPAHMRVKWNDRLKACWWLLVVITRLLTSL